MVSRYVLTLVVASVVGIFSLAAVITLIVLWLTFLTPFTDYSVVIDAGSSRSTIFVYSWPADKSNGLGTTSNVNQVKSCIVNGSSISTIASPPTVQLVTSYFDAAMQLCINEIPSTRKYRALIFLGATAGLRLTNITDPNYVAILLNSTRTYFSSLGLMFNAPENQVRIISGAEEGLSGWITANMLMQQFLNNNQPSQTYGILDMGGASTQISFYAPNATKENYTISLFNQNYPVYSYSYLCYGQDQTRLSYLSKLVEQANGSIVIDDPCLQRNYSQLIPFNTINSSACTKDIFVAPVNLTQGMNITFRGLGDYSTCRARLVQQRLSTVNCSSTSNCSFNGVYQPSLNGSTTRFFAVAAFYNTFDSLADRIPVSPDSNGNYNLSNLTFSGLFSTVQNVCNESWTSVITNDTRFRPLLCFNAIYHWSLIQNGYSMNDNNLKNFQVVRAIDSNDVGWALGYMINQTNYLDPQYRPARLISQPEFIGIIICFLVILVSSIIAIIVACVCHRRHRRPQAKKSF